MIKEKTLKFIEWDECKRNFIRQVEIDSEKIKSIIKLAMKRFIFIKSININKDNVSFIVEDYYEIFKELLVALLLKNSLKSQNHQCLITYFYRNYPSYEFEANLILQMSYLRNRLNYYGEPIDIEFYNKHEKDFASIIGLLKKLIEEAENEK